MGGAHRSGGFEADFFAFRVPALSFDVLTDWADGVEAPLSDPDELPAALERDRQRLRARLKQIGGRPEVLSAVSVASPDLIDALRVRPMDPGVEAALIRYVSRMASRPTPFGLFAACGRGSIAERTQLAPPALVGWRRHTRLDGDYLDRIVRARATELRPRLTFRPNDSLYMIAGRWRYVQTRLEGEERTHHLAEVSESAHLSRALEAAEAGARPTEIAAAVAAGGVEAGHSERYVDELIDAQVLRPDLAVTVTGSLPLDALISDLDQAGDDDVVGTLRAVREQLASIDAEGWATSPEQHASVASSLRTLAVPEKRARLLQVDATIPACGATLARSTVDDVVRAVELLHRIAPAREPSELDRFREAFSERYELREVPLHEALDDDLGVGYGTGAGDPAPLIKGLLRPQRERKATFGPREQRLLELLNRAWRGGEHELALTADDIAALESDDASPLPGAVGALVVLAHTREGPRLCVSSASGPAGASLLGRFCHADSALSADVRAHLRAEEALDPDTIHAEIVHLPSGLMSNILVRPVLREWELEWLGRSGAPPERRLPVSDLLVSLRDGRFVLRSRRLGKRILPRLTSAHNTTRRSPAVYRFLAAVQSEGTCGDVGWSWAPFDRAPFTPRVRHGRLVLACARWCVAGPELRALDSPDPVARWASVQAWREHLRLPRWTCIADGDNKLAIDFDNVLSVDTFLRAVRKREEVLLEELYPEPDDLVACAPDGRRAMELVIPLVRDAPRPARAEPVTSRRHRPGPPVRRIFAPGSEWAYLKLYTGSATADALLRDEIGPLARHLVGSGAADMWFFIRYGDPRHHLRVRFHGEAGALREPLDLLAGRALELGLAYDVQLGTYEREVERYGGPEGMLVAERLFHADSDAVVALLAMFERGEAGLDERWRIGALGSEALMRDLGLDDETRIAQAREMHTAFEAEFRADAKLRKDIAARVRAERASVAALVALTGAEDHPLAPGLGVLAERSARIEPLAAELAELRRAGRLELPLEQLAGSYVHMWLDRLCRTENRFHEYVTYALLERVLRGRAARAHAGNERGSATAWMEPPSARR